MPEFLFNKVAGLKQTLAQVFSCEFCEISKNTFFHRTPLGAGSVICDIDSILNNSGTFLKRICNGLHFRKETMEYP